MIYLAFVAITLLILFFAFYQWQHFMVFSPTYHREGELSQDCSLINMQSDDGVTLEGAIYEPENPQSTLLIFVGRSHDAVGIINKLALTYPQSRVVTFNYREYGRSEGRASEKNLLKDALKIADLLVKNYGAIFVLGYSLGASLAAYVASKRYIKALFLVGAFESIASLAQLKFAKFPVLSKIDLSPFLRYKFPTGAYMNIVDADTYLFASKDDETTYIQNVRELQVQVKNLVHYGELEGLTHKEILWEKRVTETINGVING